MYRRALWQLLCAVGGTASASALTSCSSDAVTNTGADRDAESDQSAASTDSGAGDATKDATPDVDPAEACASSKLSLEPEEQGALQKSASCQVDASILQVVCFPAPADGGACAGAYSSECVLRAYSCGFAHRADGLACQVARADSCCWLVFGDCPEGRPLLIAGRARTAALVEGSGWAAPLAPNVSSLDQQTRAALAQYWGNEALGEHASVAAFSRVILQLLGLGAPAELVNRAQRAMAEELEHAASALGLASAYAEREFAFAPLDLSGIMDGATDLTSIAVATFREGCVAETVSALILERAHTVASDAVVKAELTRVAREELEHAELAWRTLAWAVRTGESSTRAALRAELASAESWVSLGGAVPASGQRELLAAHGCLPKSERNEIAHQALTKVVLVVARALLESEPLTERTRPTASA